MMYNFIRNMWVMRRIDADTVQLYVAKYITQTQADEIISTPQIQSEE